LLDWRRQLSSIAVVAKSERLVATNVQIAIACSY